MTTRELHLRSRLLAAGYRENEVRRLTAAHGLVAVRRGAYAHPSDVRLGQPEERHLLMVRAAAEQLRGDLVMSHVSAAVLHGIAVWNVPLDRVHGTRDGRAGGRRSRQLHLHRTGLDAEDVTVVSGLSVTTADRTVADLLRALPPEEGLVVVDNALFEGLATVDGVRAVLDRAPRRWGTAAALRVLAFADARAESPGESRSRLRIHRAGLPAPDLQVPLFSVDGEPLGRGDFGWDDVVGEFDGRAKYGRLVPAGRASGDVVFAEKVREDAVRDAGRRVVRWIWPELDPFDEVRRRIERALRGRWRA